MVMRLSSHSTFRRPRPRWPARPAASWLMPSIRQPSPATHPGAVIDQIVAEHRIEMPLGDRHADRHRQALAERAGGRLDAVEQEILGMAGAGAAELAEMADVVDRRPRVAGQVEQGIDQHRSVPGREHETVAVGPFRVRGIELQELAEQHCRYVGHAHRHAGMAAVGGLHRVHRERANGIGELALCYGQVIFPDEKRGERSRSGSLSASAPPSTGPPQRRLRAAASPLMRLGP